jgi:hypothetical protein
VTFAAYHFGYPLRHLLNRLINLRLVTGGASLPGASRGPPLTNAITGIGGCCARAASGHAAAEVHPSEVRADVGRTETAEELGAYPEGPKWTKSPIQPSGFGASESYGRSYYQR